jgi:dTDP-4-dehydrorhamnose 3,5-epimerase-like enzyme
MSIGKYISAVELIEFPTLGDERGELIALEESQQIPFETKRVYYIYDTDVNVTRGLHAHKELEQLAVVVAGSCVFDVETIEGKQTFLLDTPTKGLYLGGLAWHAMHSFSEDCVIVVLASDVYSESDYVRDYNDFQSLIASL